MTSVPRVAQHSTDQGPSYLTTCRQWVWNHYVSVVNTCYAMVNGTRLDFIGSVLATLLLEPMSTLYAGSLMRIKLADRKLTNCNPQKLSKEQEQHMAVACITGDHSEEEVLVDIITKLAAKRPHSPVFPIKLGDGIITKKEHLLPLIAKVRQIVALYPLGNCPGIVFVGHSSGGNILPALVCEILTERNPLQVNGKPLNVVCIKLGSTMKDKEIREVVGLCPIKEICGTYDVFEGTHSLLPDSPLPVKSGHLGLLFDEEVIEQIIAAVPV